MPSRIRNRSGPRIEGTMDWGGVTQPFGVDSMTEYCSDFVGRPDRDNPLRIAGTKREGGVINRKGVWPAENFNACPVNFQKPPLIKGLPWGQTQVSRILAQTGPLTPRLYSAVSIFELKDIPKMLMHAGNLLHGIRSFGTKDFLPNHRLSPAQEIASSTLAYQFGWAPLIEDIQKMLNFSEQVKRRQLTLLRAHSSKGVRQKVKISSDQQTGEGVDQTWSVYLLQAYQRWSDVRTSERWSTVRWKVRDLSQVGKVPTYMDGFKAVYGLERGHIPIAIWKAMPWSWAIDWFADISNMMQASYNMIYYEPTNLNIMTKSISTRTYYPYLFPDGDGFVSGGEVREKELIREQFAPVNTIKLRLPFLDNFKLSIVGSMSILALARK